MGPTYIRDAVAYTCALGITTVTVLSIGLPSALSGAPSLVDEYYGKGWPVYAFDWVLVAIYLCAGAWAARKMGTTLWVGSAVAAVAISGAFCVYYLSRPKSPAFFSRWFHTAGLGAVAYDVILVSCTAWLYRCIQRSLRPLRFTTGM